MDLVFSQMHKNALDAWKKAMDEQVSRTHTVLGRFAETEAQSELAAHVAIDEWARLAKETMRFQMELSSEWRKQSLEAMQKMMSMSVPFATPKAAESKPAT
jgi:aryl carrier-like protein